MGKSYVFGTLPLTVENLLRDRSFHDATAPVSFPPLSLARMADLSINSAVEEEEDDG